MEKMGPGNRYAAVLALDGEAEATDDHAVAEEPRPRLADHAAALPDATLGVVPAVGVRGLLASTRAAVALHARRVLYSAAALSEATLGVFPAVHHEGVLGVRALLASTRAAVAPHARRVLYVAAASAHRLVALFVGSPVVQHVAVFVPGLMETAHALAGATALLACFAAEEPRLAGELGEVRRGDDGDAAELPAHHHAHEFDDSDAAAAHRVQAARARQEHRGWRHAARLVVHTAAATAFRVVALVAGAPVFQGVAAFVPGLSEVAHAVSAAAALIAAAFVVHRTDPAAHQVGGA